MQPLSTTAVVSAVLLLVVALSAGCSHDGDRGGSPESSGTRPNGVAKMKPGRAVEVARKAMNGLHDAVFEAALTMEIEGKTRKVRLDETITADGCLRVTSHPDFGRTWTRVIGKTMWIKANDQASESLGRTAVQTELFRGRWLKLPATELLRGCALDQLLPGPALADVVEARGTTTVADRRGRRFRVEIEGVVSSWVIATEGPPIVIATRTATPADVLTELPAELAYDYEGVLVDTDTGAEITPPPDRLVIDPSGFLTATA